MSLTPLWGGADADVHLGSSDTHNAQKRTLGGYGAFE